MFHLENKKLHGALNSDYVGCYTCTILCFDKNGRSKNKEIGFVFAKIKLALTLQNIFASITALSKYLSCGHIFDF